MKDLYIVFIRLVQKNVFFITLWEGTLEQEETYHRDCLMEQFIWLLQNVGHTISHSSGYTHKINDLDQLNLALYHGSFNKSHMNVTFGLKRID
mgnify:FL=1